MDVKDGNDKSKLESLNERIYSRISPLRMKRRRILRSFKRHDVSESIPKEDDPQSETPLPDIPEEIQDFEEKSTFWTASKIFLIISVIFFIFSSTMAYFYIIRGINEVDQGKIAILVKGPNNVSSGELMQLQIIIENQNNVPLELADLIVDYPTGTLVPGKPYETTVVNDGKGGLKKVVRERVELKSIGPHELKKGVVKARLFGQKDEEAKINVVLQYRVKGSSAVFAVNKVYSVRFVSEALNISVDGPTEAIFGQKPNLTVTLKNTSQESLLNTKLEALLPLGVKIVSSNPEGKNNAWIYPEIKPGEEKSIKLTLQVDGQTGDERVIKFQAGIDNSDKNSEKLDNVFGLAEHKLVISRPFLLTELVMPRKVNDYFVVKPGVQFDASIKWENTLPDSMEDLVLAMTMEGAALDKYKVSVPKGFYKSKNNLVIWDKTTVGRVFESIPSGAFGKLDFTLGTKNTRDLARVINPSIILTLHAAAKRPSVESGQDVLNSFLEKEIRVETDLEASVRSLYFDNPLKSAGALPPKVDTPTIYGVEWTVTNSTNLVQDAEMIGYLPPNVEWGKVTLPSTESVEFNPTTGKIVWHLGDIKPGTGYYLPARKIYFNVVLIPSVTQLGKTPVLVKNIRLTGKDTFTDTDLSQIPPYVTTKISEPQASSFYYNVVK